jgi:putative aminopeptidase FrvX
MTRDETAFLMRLLACPTAPFREELVARLVEERLARRRIPYFRDPAGNLIVGCGNAREYKQRLGERSREPLRILIAHMDHPGFHGQRWNNRGQLEVRWHGGSPTRFLAGSSVWLTDGEGWHAKGHLTAPKLARGGRYLARAAVVLEPRRPERPAARTIYGGFAFRAAAWRRGPLLYTKAADDLVGVFAIVNAAERLFRKGGRPPFLGVLTRAEEVGFVGAIAHLELGLLKAARRPLLAVSLETSRALPGAQIGKGPVVRLGDRRGPFDPAATQVLTQVARRTLPKRHQRRIMDGGSCEASAALAWGLPAIGISVPLGNYHNQGLEGGPDCRGRNGPAPEFVHLDDVNGLLKLCRALVERGLPWGHPWKAQRGQLERNARSYRRLL